MTPMMAMTTKSSTNVNPNRLGRIIALFLINKGRKTNRTKSFPTRLAERSASGIGLGLTVKPNCLLGFGLSATTVQVAQPIKAKQPNVEPMKVVYGV